MHVSGRVLVIICFHFSWVYTPGLELRGQMVTLCPTLWGMARWFCTAVVPFYASTSNTQRFKFSTSSPTLIIWHFYYSSFSGYEMAVHCGFELILFLLKNETVNLLSRWYACGSFSRKEIIGVVYMLQLQILNGTQNSRTRRMGFSWLLRQVSVYWVFISFWARIFSGSVKRIPAEVKRSPCFQLYKWLPHLTSKLKSLSA